ncbi:MAG: aspartate/glutamate racemase family protein, partial [Pseudomonadota bacterium]
MQLLLVNPNTTDSMTKKMVTAANAVAATGSHIVGRTATYGPVSIEGYYDEVFSVPPLLEAISAHADADGVIVGCFDDTGVDAARCITDRPVIGICQAAMQHAAVVATRFSVVTTLSRSVPALEHLALKYGYERLCRRVRASEVPVLALEDGDPTALNKIKAEIALALRDDEAEAIVLGCGGMADLATQLSGEF